MTNSNPVSGNAPGFSKTDLVECYHASLSLSGLLVQIYISGLIEQDNRAPRALLILEAKRMAKSLSDKLSGVK